jgi:serine/threonine protein kinase
VIKGIQVAVKIPKKQDWASDELRSFREEVAITRSAFHTNVVLFLGACTVPGKIMLVVERMVCDMATLLHHKERAPPQLVREPLTLLRKLRMAHDTALGISWLHDILSVVHRDLKPANLLLDENLRVKVTDFGFRFVKEKGRMVFSLSVHSQTHQLSSLSEIFGGESDQEEKPREV